MINFTRLRTWYERILAFGRRHATWLRRGVQVLIIVSCVGYLLFNVRQIHRYRDLLQLNGWYLLLSWILIFAALWLGALAWHLVLRSVGIDLPHVQVAWSHLSANLAKYIPGYGWQLVGKAYLTKQLGVSTRIVSLAMVSELAILFLSGAALAAGLVWRYAVTTIESLHYFVLVSGITAVLILVVMPYVLPWVGKRFWKISFVPSILVYWTAVFVVLVGWVFFGLAFWCLGAAIIPITVDVLPTFMFTIVGSFLVSLAVLIVPGGIGVRESVMVFLLATAVGNTPAVLIATLSRFVVLLSELGAVWIARLLAKPPVSLNFGPRNTIR